MKNEKNADEIDYTCVLCGNTCLSKIDSEDEVEVISFLCGTKCPNFGKIKFVSKSFVVSI